MSAYPPVWNTQTPIDWNAKICETTGTAAQILASEISRCVSSVITTLATLLVTRTKVTGRNSLRKGLLPLPVWEAFTMPCVMTGKACWQELLKTSHQSPEVTAHIVSEAGNRKRRMPVLKSLSPCLSSSVCAPSPWNGATHIQAGPPLLSFSSQGLPHRHT